MIGGDQISGDSEQLDVRLIVTWVCSSLLGFVWMLVLPMAAALLLARRSIRPGVLGCVAAAALRGSGPAAGSRCVRVPAPVRVLCAFMDPTLLIWRSVVCVQACSNDAVRLPDRQTDLEASTHDATSQRSSMR